MENHGLKVSDNDALYKVEVDAFMKGINDRQNIESNSGYGFGYNSRYDAGNHHWNESGNDSWNSSTSFNNRKKSRFTPFPFDPNTADEADWIRMGFSERQAAVILKYRSKGGHFTRKEDFSRLYIVDEETYRIFEPYITIHDSFQKNSYRANQSAKSNQLNNTNLPYRNDQRINRFSNNESLTGAGFRIELNSADSLELLKINGVGPVFASRILKYRKKLGGFATTQQLREVYGMDSLRFAGIEDQIKVDTLLIREIKVNTSSLVDLRKHPYLDYYSAKALIDKRVQLGGFTTSAEVESALSGKPGLFRKLRPYIKIH